MKRSDEPDVARLGESGDVRSLLRVLRWSRGVTAVKAAQTLAGMNLNAKHAEAARKLILKSLKRERSWEVFSADSLVAGAAYRHSLILLDRMSPTDTLLSVYALWFNVYMQLLRQHRSFYHDSFKLGVDSDRIRYNQVVAMANRVMASASGVYELTANGSVQLPFVLSTIGNIEELAEFEGLEFLSVDASAGELDWSRSRTVYKRLCGLVEQSTRLKYGLDHHSWSRLRDNALALVLSGDIDLLSAEHHTAKAFSEIARRKDLQAPSRTLVDAMALQSFRLIGDRDLRNLQFLYG